MNNFPLVFMHVAFKSQMCMLLSRSLISVVVHKGSIKPPGIDDNSNPIQNIKFKAQNSITRSLAFDKKGIMNLMCCIAQAKSML